jgi:hypothetical protein
MAELMGTPTEYSDEAAAVKYAYDAPFAGLGEEGVTGPRRFPLSIPFHDPVSGNAEEQEKHFGLVNATKFLFTSSGVIPTTSSLWTGERSGTH